MATEPSRYRPPQDPGSSTFRAQSCPSAPMRLKVVLLWLNLIFKYLRLIRFSAVIVFVMIKAWVACRCRLRQQGPAIADAACATHARCGHEPRREIASAPPQAQRTSPDRSSAAANARRIAPRLSRGSVRPAAISALPMLARARLEAGSLAPGAVPAEAPAWAPLTDHSAETVVLW